MLNHCDYCGHVGGHSPYCPEAPNPKPFTHCIECGAPIYIGDEVCQVGGYGSNKIICAQCFLVTEVEEPEPNEDLAYDTWRDKQL